jgi:hypothetical protein
MNMGIDAPWEDQESMGINHPIRSDMREVSKGSHRLPLDKEILFDHGLAHHHPPSADESSSARQGNHFHGVASAEASSKTRLCLQFG